MGNGVHGHFGAHAVNLVAKVFRIDQGAALIHLHQMVASHVLGGLLTIKSVTIIAVRVLIFTFTNNSSYLIIE